MSLPRFRPLQPPPPPPIEVAPLPPVVHVPPRPARPARETDIGAAFCSGWDRRGVPVHDTNYFVNRWMRLRQGDREAREDFYDTLELKATAGVTHFCATLPDGAPYRDYARLGFIPGGVPNYSLGGARPIHPEMIAMMEEVFRFLPYAVWYCYGGGQGKDGAEAIYDQRLRLQLEHLRDLDWGPRLVVNWAWESFGKGTNERGEVIPPECTSRQNQDAWQQVGEIIRPVGGGVGMHVGPGHPMRANAASFYGSLDDRHVAAAEALLAQGVQPARVADALRVTGPRDAAGRPCVLNHELEWVERDDRAAHLGPTREIESYYVPGGDEPTHFFMQWPNGMPSAEDLPDLVSHVIKLQDRFWPTGTPLPAVGRGIYRRYYPEEDAYDDTPHTLPRDWFAGAVHKRKGGRPILTAWEMGEAFHVSRNLTTPAAIRAHDRVFRDLGLTSRGNLPVAL